MTKIIRVVGLPLHIIGIKLTYRKPRAGDPAPNCRLCLEPACINCKMLGYRLNKDMAWLLPPRRSSLNRLNNISHRRHQHERIKSTTLDITTTTTLGYARSLPRHTLKVDRLDRRCRSSLRPRSAPDLPS
jgi:hypothetical protein